MPLIHPLMLVVYSEDRFNNRKNPTNLNIQTVEFHLAAKPRLDGLFLVLIVLETHEQRLFVFPLWLLESASMAVPNSKSTPLRTELHILANGDTNSDHVD